VAYNEARILSGFSVEQGCNSSGNYDCESTTFSPGAAGTTAAVAQQCADVAALGHVCLTVDSATVPTQSLGATTIYHCSNTTVLGNNGYLFQSHAGSLEAALSGAVARCQARSP
jgi:hypothetical protein